MTNPIPTRAEVGALLPCPFCGAGAEMDRRQAYRNIRTGNLKDAAAIYCLGCGVHMTFCYEDAPEISHEQICDDLIAAWNRRATLDAPQAALGNVPEREAFWLIERSVSPSQYVSLNSAGWHHDVWQARRFKTEREAHDEWRMMPGRDQFKIIEHMFINKVRQEEK